MKYQKYYKKGEDIMNLSFIYFNFPFLKAEVNRVALHIGNIKYNEIWVTHDELIRAKDPGKLDKWNDHSIS